MPELFATALNQILADARPEKRRTVEEIASYAGCTPWTVYKWVQDDGTHAINNAARLAAELERQGDPRLSACFHSGRSALTPIMPSRTDGDTSREVQAVLAGLSDACRAWDQNPYDGPAAVAAMQRACVDLLAEFQRRIGQLSGSPVQPGGDGADSATLPQRAQ
jgi:hypothetical protein